MFNVDEIKILEEGRSVTEHFLKHEKWTAASTAPAASLKIQPKVWVQTLLENCSQIYYKHIQRLIDVGVPEDGSEDPELEVLNVVWYYPPSLNGWHPLHLASLSGNLEVCQQIIGLDPSSVNSVMSELNVTPMMCAAFGGWVQIVGFLISSGSELKKYADDINFWAIKGGNVECCQKLLTEQKTSLGGGKLNLCTLITNGILKDDVKLLNILIEHNGKDSLYQKSKDGEPILLLAVGKGLLNCIKHLILKLHASVLDANNFGHTSLHKAILSSSTDELAVNILHILIHGGANVNHVDKERRRPIRYAANKGFSKCVFKLINNGAVITMEDLEKLNERIPNFIEKHLNGLIAMRGITQTNCRVLIAISLRLTGVTGNWSWKTASKSLLESSFINFCIQDGQKHLLLHPVMETFLTIKWIFVRKYFFIGAAYYVLLLLVFTCFIMETYVNVHVVKEDHHDNLLSKNDTSEPLGSAAAHSTSRTSLIIFSWLSLTLIISRIISIILNIIIFGPKSYLRRNEHLFHAVILITMILSHCNPSIHGSLEIPEWQTNCAAVASFLGWTYILQFIRREPTLGIYVEMLHLVFTNIAKFLLTYTCLLIAFAISFMILFSKKTPFPNTIANSIHRVLGMMIGETNYENENKEKEFDNYATHLFYGMFIITVTIALINLLIGLAVNDIKGLRKKSKLHKLMRELAFITDLEDLFSSPKLPKILPYKIINYLQNSIHLQPTHQTVFIYPNNANDKRLNKELKQAALRIATQHELDEYYLVNDSASLNPKKSFSSSPNSTTTVEVQLKSIQKQLSDLLENHKSQQE